MAVAALYWRSSQMDLALLLLCIFGVAFLSKSNATIGAVDWSMLSLAGFELFSIAFLRNRAGGFASARAIVLALLVFFAIRLTFRTLLQTVSFGAVLGFGGAWLGFQGLHHFGMEASRLANAGFTNLLPFRSRLIAPPAPWVVGEWFTLLLLALPFACTMPLFFLRRGSRWLAAVILLPPLIVTATLTISLSRAVFWSTVVFYVCACGLLVFSKTMSLRTGAVVLLAALCAMGVIFTCESALYPSILNAYAGQHTSQARSTQGRVEIWSRALQLVRKHPVLGVGSSNAALMLLSSADDEETAGFASRTFSLPVQILLEKGIIGSFLYMLFLVLVARESLRTIRRSPPIPNPKGRKYQANAAPPGANSDADSAYKAMICCFGAGLVAVLFRELTYSSLMEHSLTMVLFAALAALVCCPSVVNDTA